MLNHTVAYAPNNGLFDGTGLSVKGILLDIPCCHSRFRGTCCHLHFEGLDLVFPLSTGQTKCPFPPAAEPYFSPPGRTYVFFGVCFDQPSRRRQECLSTFCFSKTPTPRGFDRTPCDPSFFPLRLEKEMYGDLKRGLGHRA